MCSDTFFLANKAELLRGSGLDADLAFTYAHDFC